jgi:CheY-like chemotaxis protein
MKTIEADFFPRLFGVDSSPLKPATDSAAKGIRRILIVDNDSNSTHLVKILLERSGPYRVMEENDATKAHQTAGNCKPDLILLEVVMSGLDGGEVAEQIQADRELRNTPIIFLTGLVTKAEAKSGLHIQGRPAVAKPINIPELIDAIEQNLSLGTELWRMAVAWLPNCGEITVGKIQPRAPARLQLQDFPGRDRYSRRH